MTRGVQPLLSLLLISAPAVCAAHAHHVHVLRDGQLLGLWDHGPEVPLVSSFTLIRSSAGVSTMMAAFSLQVRMCFGLIAFMQALEQISSSLQTEQRHSHHCTLAGWDDIGSSR